MHVELFTISNIFRANEFRMNNDILSALAVRLSKIGEIVSEAGIFQ